jgi:hypothetical protein
MSALVLRDFRRFDPDILYQVGDADRPAQAFFTGKFYAIDNINRLDKWTPQPQPALAISYLGPELE